MANPPITDMRVELSKDGRVQAVEYDNTTKRPTGRRWDLHEEVFDRVAESMVRRQRRCSPTLLVRAVQIKNAGWWLKVERQQPVRADGSDGDDLPF